MREGRITVPLEPVSVNHYQSMRNDDGRIRDLRDQGAGTFMAAVAVLAGGAHLRAGVTRARVTNSSIDCAKKFATLPRCSTPRMCTGSVATNFLPRRHWA